MNHFLLIPLVVLAIIFWGSLIITVVMFAFRIIFGSAALVIDVIVTVVLALAWCVAWCFGRAKAIEAFRNAKERR